VPKACTICGRSFGIGWNFISTGSFGRISPIWTRIIFPIGILETADRTGIPRILSIGAGDATQEIVIAQELARRGRPNIEIVCADLLPALVAQASEKIRAAGLVGRGRAVQCDLNTGFPPEEVGGVTATDSLHQMLRLETLFERVEKAIGPNGSFILRDVVGRNGHMRWPEVLEPLRALWRRLPARLQRHHLNGMQDPWFENFDGSVEGLERIRCQDIMQVLQERFDFSGIMTYGGLVDPFVDRIYGPNLSPDREGDRLFIDRLQDAEDRLRDAGAVFPTQIYAIARRRGTVDLPPLREVAHRSVHDPATARAILLEDVGFELPYATGSDAADAAAPAAWGPANG
jgi:hypothetical protein